ncbi:hypothetical protein GQX74_009462 [Glossina fuscipes]|nr:hypothetical protein GQX74_009462 [Glossina fuscipes]
MPLNYIEQSGVIHTPSPNYSLCNKNVNTNNCHIKTGCEHFFHKNCFNKYIENNSNCPQCGVALTSHSTKNNPNSQTQMITRQQTRNQNTNLDTEALQPEQIINVGVTDDEESRINRLVTAAVTAQQTQLFSELKQQMTSLVQSSLETTFRNFSAQDSSLSMPSFETRQNISQIPSVQRTTAMRIDVVDSFVTDDLKDRVSKIGGGILIAVTRNMPSWHTDEFLKIGVLQLDEL